MDAMDEHGLPEEDEAPRGPPPSDALIDYYDHGYSMYYDDFDTDDEF
jgi:hypothetical protein